MNDNNSEHVLVSTDRRRNLVIVDYRHLPCFDPAAVLQAAEERVALGIKDQRVLVYAGSSFYDEIDSYNFNYSVNTGTVTRAVAFVAESPMDYQKIREFGAKLTTINSFKVFRDETTAASWLAAQ